MAAVVIVLRVPIRVRVSQLTLSSGWMRVGNILVTGPVRMFNKTVELWLARLKRLVANPVQGRGRPISLHGWVCIRGLSAGNWRARVANGAIEPNRFLVCLAGPGQGRGFL